MMGIRQIYLIWILANLGSYPYFPLIEPRDYIIPITILAILSQNTKVKEVTTTTSSSPMDPTTAIQTTFTTITTELPQSCVTCELFDTNMVTCAMLSCDQEGARCATSGDVPNVPMVCGQAVFSQPCIDIGCIFDFETDTCTPANRQLTCTGIFPGICASFNDCCDVGADNTCVDRI